MKRVALYPFLFITYLALDLLSRNLDQIEISQSLPSTFSLYLLTALVTGILWIFIRDFRLANYIVFLMLFFFFVNSHVYNVLQDVATLPETRWMPLFAMFVWGTLIVILGFVFWRLIPDKKDLTLFLNIVFLAVLLPSGYRFIQAWSGGLGNVVTVSMEVLTTSDPAVYDDLLETGGIQLQAEAPPDIYVIILDGYGRSDVLDELYEFDNSYFIDELSQRGFYVAENSYSNYIQTLLSLSSLLNFDYFENWIPQESEPAYMSYTRNPVAQNRLFKLLKEQGYAIIAIANIYETHLMQDVDQLLNPFLRLNHFESLLVSGTPLAVMNDFVRLGLLPSQSFEMQRRLIDFSFQELGEVAEIEGPKLVYVHIISPHPPFVFDQDGHPVQPDHSFTWADGNHYKGNQNDYIDSYRQQVIFVSEQILNSLDQILDNSTNPPVIILQSDHGPGSLLDWEKGENTCLWERTSILNAYYLPGEVAEGLYAEITPVNTFRVILNSYFGADLELLDDRVYYTPWGARATMTEVTGQIDLKENCNR